MSKGSFLSTAVPPHNFNFKLLMHPSVRQCLLLVAFSPAIVTAGEASFSGTWTIDLRTAAEKKQNFECGKASFVLSQSGDKITGSHEMATPRCGRVNEGGEGTVKGVVVGAISVLIVTSGRNGAMVLGTAKLRGDSLQWQTREEIKAGEPEGDSPLILGHGVLMREKK